MLFIVFFTILTLGIVLTIVIANNVMRKRDVEQIRDRVLGKSPTAQKATAAAPLMKTDEKPTREVVARAVLGQNLNQKLRTFIEQAGVDWDPARMIFMSMILAVAGFNLFWYVVPRGQPISFLGVLAGGGGPFLYIYTCRRKRLRKFEEQFPDALEFASRAMRSGHAFSVSLEMLHKEYDPPLGYEFRRLFEEQNLGLPLDIALERLARRVPLLDVQFFVSAVILQKRTGGNLAGLLDNLAYLMRERFKLRGRIRSISAHGRISGLVLSMIPLAVALMMFFTNPEYVLFFLDDPDGKIMLVVCIFLQFLGFVSIRKITDIGV